MQVAPTSGKRKKTGLTAWDQTLLSKHLRFYQQLASRDREPNTEAQRRFVLVLEGRVKPVSVGEMASVKGGKRLPKGQKASAETTPHPYITVRDFNDNGTVSVEKLGYITPEIHAGISRHTISSADVYVSIAGTIGKTGIVLEELNGANLTENAAKLVLQEGWNKHFGYWWTRPGDFTEQAAEQTRVAAQPKLALQCLASITLPNAPISAQLELHDGLQALKGQSNRIAQRYEADLRDLDDLRQSILQMAFAGELT